MTGLAGLYDSRFYAGQRGTSFDAAAAILPMVIDLLRPASVVDVGCGVGTWLRAAERLGVGRLVGLEGPWVKKADLLSPTIELVTHHLERPIPIKERFDLAMSLEVAEHVSEGRADALIAEMCALAPHVLFGAAIPGQGGVNHINEQWQGYWVRKFGDNGFRPLDIIRPTFWHDERILVHYRQNTFLFVHESVHEDVVRGAGDMLAARWEYDIVHPEVHLSNHAALVSLPTVGQSLRSVAALPGALLRSVRQRLTGRSATPPRGQ
jgi:SAM-dependent methyltransferase